MDRGNWRAVVHGVLRSWTLLSTTTTKGAILLFVVQLLSCVRLCDPVDCSTPGFPVLHYLPEFAQIHVH